MQSRHFLITSLVCVGLLAGTTTLAHASQQSAAPQAQAQASKPAPPPMTRDERDAQRTIPGAYRLTYTLTDMDGDRKIGAQHYAIVLDADALEARLNLEANVPVHVGSGNTTDYRTENTGLRIFARLRQFANGLELNTVIHQTAFADGTKAEPASIGLPPITRQAELSSTVLLTENKPVTIGDLDIPGTTHRMQVQVELTRVR